MRGKILTLLRERKDYVSGQELCEHFGVSRTAVWKAIGKLKEEGYQIEAVTNKGYRLVEESAPERYGQHELESRMETTWAGKPVFFYPETDSTNVRAKLAAEEGQGSGALFVADKQTAGRGRRGRSWESPAGSNIYFTLLLRPTFHPEVASMLTLLIAMAMTKATLEEMGEEAKGHQVGIKWPNDVVVDGKKVCGILTEMSTEPNHIQYVVMGVGINVGHQDFPEEIADKATSLEDVLGRKVNRSKFLPQIMKHFETIYETFIQTEDMSGLLEEYNVMLVNQDKEVRVLDPKGEYEGIARGINAKGELLVETQEGIKEVYAGEVSVRGIYGYV